MCQPGKKGGGEPCWEGILSFNHGIQYRIMISSEGEDQYISEEKNNKHIEEK